MIQTCKRPLSIHLIKRIISITPKKRVLTLLKLYRICGQVLKCLVVLLRCPRPGDWPSIHQSRKDEWNEWKFPFRSIFGRRIGSFLIIGMMNDTSLDSPPGMETSIHFLSFLLCWLTSVGPCWQSSPDLEPCQAHGNSAGMAAHAEISSLWEMVRKQWSK